MTQSSAIKGVFFALATSLVGSTAAAAGKLIADQVNPYSIVMIQFSICFLLCLPQVYRHQTARLKTNQWRLHLIRGLGGWLAFIAFYASLGKISLVEANLLRNTAPLMVPLVVWAWIGLLVPLNRWVPLLIGFVGVSLVLAPKPGDANLNSGYLLGLASGLGLAISMVGTRILSKTDSSLQIMFYYFALSLVCSLPLGIYHWQPIPLSAWPHLIFIGVSIYLALWLYTLAYSYAKPSLVSPISYFSVVFSGVLGWWLWGFVPGTTSMLGITLVVAAGIVTVYLSSLEKDKSE
ncbi:MAG: DMT family transporter [Candidatus Pelagadaptatus aseana]|uniref:DMT family transporter n=1 Tax=Candidatus Pelagadaptatus aseana TaxID=3120508 RepID=UPI0039B14F4B